MGTRTYSRRGVLTRLGRQRAGLEAIDILGRPIANEEPVSDLGTPVTLTGEALTNALADPDSYPSGTIDYFTKDDSYPLGKEHAKPMSELDLDINDKEHRKIFALLMGVGSTAYVDPRAMETTYDNEFGRYKIETEGDFDDSTVRTVRIMEVSANGGAVTITNQLFKAIGSPKGMGYAMLRQQMWAARRLNELTGMEVWLETDALSDAPAGQGQSDDYNGAHTWPKLGYRFDFRGQPELNAAIRSRGFTSRNSVDLMSERNADGVLGVDAWSNIVDDVVGELGMFNIRGEMIPSKDTDAGVQVMQNYARRKGLSKSESNEGVDGMNLTAEDNDWLRQLWLTYGKKK